MTIKRPKGQPFNEFAAQCKGDPGIIIAVDPGETTGWAVFEAYRMLGCGQLPTGSIPLALQSAMSLFRGDNWACNLSTMHLDHLPADLVAQDRVRPAASDPRLNRPVLSTHGHAVHRVDDRPSVPKVVIEDYRVYTWKADDHKLSSVFTVKVLGIFEAVALLYGYPVTLTGASLAKTFCKDDRLADWGFWEPGMRHARDAIRHATYQIVRQSLAAKPKVNRFDS